MKRSKRPEVKLPSGEVVGSLYLRGRLWWFDHRGKGVRAPISLKTSDLKEALQLAEQAAQGIAPLPQAPTRVEKLQGKTVREALTLYTEKHLQKKCRESSASRAADSLEPFVAFVGEQKSIGSITRQLVQKFLDSGTATKKNITINGDKRRVGAFLNWCELEEIIAKAPNLKKMLLPVEQKDARGLTPEEIKTIREELPKVKDERIRSILVDWFELGINVGLRPDEQAHLRACDYDPASRKATVRPWGDWKPKTAKG
ncbi:MAG TPA: hypothetical protein VKU80_10595, partial [Planctomycetota bacterium]|nr:hypothetical protein [Planctomycetota bacterium]